MRALVGILIMGLLAIVACNKNDGGGTATTVGGFATTPQTCNTASYLNGMCPQSTSAIIMPGAWPLGTGWSFPNPWNAQQYSCGCPRVTVAYPGQPAFTQEQIGVFFAASNAVACAPLGYFSSGNQMFVGNVNALIQQMAFMGVNVGAGAGMNPYSRFNPASGYGAYYGSNYGYGNYYPVNNPQMYGSYGAQTGVTDPAARTCMNKMVIGCDLALEQRLSLQGGGSQCNGVGTCVPAVPNQPSSTLGYCAFGNPYGAF